MEQALAYQKEHREKRVGQILHLTAGQLAHFLKGKVVERIVRHDLEALVRKADRKQVLLFRQL